MFYMLLYARLIFNERNKLDLLNDINIMILFF